MITPKTIIGCGLIALDLLKRGNDETVVYRHVGGTCGNVLMFLARLGWSAYPLARLDDSENTNFIVDEMRQEGINTQFISKDGKTPVIIQRNTIDKDGKPAHHFEMSGGHFGPEYTAITKKSAITIADSLDFTPGVFFFDRLSAAALYLAERFRRQGSLIYFEPSSPGALHNDKYIKVSDIIKFSDQRIHDLSVFDSHSDKTIIQTLGADGLKYRTPSSHVWLHFPANSSETIIDTSGAGDILSATLIDNMENLPIDDNIRLSQSSSIRNCTVEGARGSMYKQ